MVSNVGKNMAPAIWSAPAVAGVGASTTLAPDATFISTLSVPPPCAFHHYSSIGRSQLLGAACVCRRLRSGQGGGGALRGGCPRRSTAVQGYGRLASNARVHDAEGRRGVRHRGGHHRRRRNGHGLADRVHCVCVCRVSHGLAHPAVQCSHAQAFVTSAAPVRETASQRLWPRSGLGRRLSRPRRAWSRRCRARSLCKP